MKNQLIAKLHKKIKTYNEKADKWGYLPIKVNILDKSISPFEIDPNAPDEKLNFFTKIREIYRYGYLEGEWDKIYDLLYRL